MSTEYQTPPALDFALFDAQKQRSVQNLRNAGIIETDDKQAIIQFDKRANHLLNGYYDELLPQYRNALKQLQAEAWKKLDAAPYAEVVKSGYLNQFLEKAVALLAQDNRERMRHLDQDPLVVVAERDPKAFNTMHKELETNAKKYEGEAKYYAGNQEYVQEMLLKAEPVAKTHEYLPMGKLVARSGIIQGTQAFVDDLVSDALSVVEARKAKQQLRAFGDDAAIARYEADPKANDVRIKAMAERVKQTTKSMAELKQIENETLEFKRIKALDELVSAQLFEAMSHANSLEQLALVERDARDLTFAAEQVGMSLAAHYLETGAASNDTRIKTIKTNLLNEMKADQIGLLSVEQAHHYAAKFARIAAEDLLQLAAGNAEMTQTITQLVADAGVDVANEPLKAKVRIIAQTAIPNEIANVASMSKAPVERTLTTAA